MVLNRAVMESKGLNKYFGCCVENRLEVVEMGHEVRSRKNRSFDDVAWVRAVEMKIVGGFWICSRRKANRAVDGQTVGNERNKESRSLLGFCLEHTDVCWCH